MLDARPKVRWHRSFFPAPLLLLALFWFLAPACTGTAMFEPRLLEFSDQQLTFGLAAPGVLQQLQVTITNIDSESIDLDDLYLDGDAPNAFFLINELGEAVPILDLGMSLAAEQSLTLTLGFLSPAEGSFSAKLVAGYRSERVGQTRQGGCVGSFLIPGDDRLYQALPLFGTASFEVLRPEDCGDFFDNDGDQLADCLDADCRTNELCAVPDRERDCGDRYDNDIDGTFDCFDSDCNFDSLCAEDCFDQVDNDLDRLIDCADQTCSVFAHCAPIDENCTDGLDNDDDLAIDCADDDCVTLVPCNDSEDEFGGACSDFIDNDSDGALDCFDSDCNGNSDCSADPQWCCEPTAALGCLDGAVTACVCTIDPYCCFAAWDSSCAGLAQNRCSAGCVAAAELCLDGYDNDGDGAVDCTDSDCSTTQECAGAAPEICTDGLDNDGDRWTDCDDLDCDGFEEAGQQLCPDYFFTSRNDQQSDFGIGTPPQHTSLVQWELGVPAAAAGGGPGAAFDGARSWCTSCALDAELGGRFNQGLIVTGAALDFSGLVGGRMELRFFHWMAGESDSAADQARVVALTGGPTGVRILWEPHNAETNGWREVSIDVSSLLGTSGFRLVLQYDSVDAIDSNPGWFVDVVELRYSP